MKELASQLGIDLSMVERYERDQGQLNGELKQKINNFNIFESLDIP